MFEKIGDIFSYDLKALRCITTNGVVKKNGELTMGAGIALAAKQNFPRLPKLLGDLVHKTGNHVYILPEIRIASFPTKHDWRDKSDLNLIEQSCKELVEKTANWELILLPRVGTANGKLSWEQVKPILSKYLDDRFVILVQ